MLRVALSAFILSLPELALAACKRPASVVELETTLQTAESAYGHLDMDAFEEAMDKARKQVLCISEEITPLLAAELHRLEGMLAFAHSNKSKAESAFAAARSIEPDYQFPTNIVPPGNSLLGHYEAQAPVCDKERIPPAKDGKLRVDGQRQRTMPMEFPAIIQVIHPKSSDGITQYHWPGEPLIYEPGSSRTPIQKGLLIGGATVAAVGIGTFLVAQASTSTTIDDAPSAIRNASLNRSTGSVAGAGILGAGLLAVGFSFPLPSKEAAP